MIFVHTKKQIDELENEKIKTIMKGILKIVEDNEVDFLNHPNCGKLVRSTAYEDSFEEGLGGVFVVFEKDDEYDTYYQYYWDKKSGESAVIKLNKDDKGGEPYDPNKLQCIIKVLSAIDGAETIDLHDNGVYDGVLVANDSFSYGFLFEEEFLEAHEELRQAVQDYL